MNKCYHCKENDCELDFNSLVQDIYCLDCKWETHYKRQWHNRNTSKEEWKLLYRRFNYS